MTALTERLVEIAQQARVAPHGQKEAVYQSACRELGFSRPTLLRKLKTVTDAPKRKRRNDAGNTVLARKDAEIIAAWMKSHTRANGKKLMSLEHTLEILSSNGEINIDRINTETGEVTQLSVSTIRRALKTYGLDDATMSAPAPAIQLSSKHPNYLWQLDFSICVLYYLPKGGLSIMEESVFEKNKPENFKKAELDRVWRGTVLDHCSGAIYVFYQFGGESAANTVELLLNAITQRQKLPFYGVPFHLYTDKGSGNTSSIFKNLCRSLQIEFRSHMPGNARATGSVEKGQDIVEREFESCLKSIDIHSIEELNTQAERWMLAYNSSRIHSRHGMTRYGAWIKITAEQLRIAPEIQLCRELARSAPIERVVDQYLNIEFKGNTYDVSELEDIHVKKKVLVCTNPYRADTVQIIQADASGHDRFYEAKKVSTDEFGFMETAAVYGEEYKSHKETASQKQAHKLDQLVTGETDKAAIAKKLKGKHKPFDGRIDPFKPNDDFVVPTYLPRKGTALNVPDLAAPEIKPLTLIEAKMRLRNLLGDALTTEQNAMLKAQWPNGVMEEELPKVAAILRDQGKPTLKVVG